MSKLAVLLLLTLLLLTACTPTPPAETTVPTEATTPTESTTAPTERDWESYYKEHAVDTGNKEEMKALMDGYLNGRLAYLTEGTEPESWEGTDDLLYDWHTTGGCARNLLEWKQRLEQLGIKVLDSRFWLPSNEGVNGAYMFHAYCVMETLTYQQEGQVYAMDVHHTFVLSTCDVPEMTFVIADEFICPFTGYEVGLNHSNCDTPDKHTLYPEPQPVPAEP